MQKKKKPIFKRWWFWIIIAPIGIRIMLDINEDLKGGTDQAAKSTSTIQENKQNKSTSPLSIGMIQDEFVKAFNSKVKELDSNNLRIENLKVKKGTENDTFQHSFTKTFFIEGTVHKKTGEIRDLMLVGSGDGTLTSVADIFVSIGAIVAVTNPELKKEERGDVLNEIGLTDPNADIIGLKSASIRNGIKYSINAATELGIVFIVAHENQRYSK
ncbi:hypothetical protein [Paenibacillus agilis]|uniref:Uncharacterized protein n=1 Tax=Paenibacillus agilis TaxID=3020863 RepID=A0A559IZL8_9BACL|nr:hypothetical protein [Paenibacillus agilis]TVX93069.1 hypothetical protein FPZ44_08345 [Paenibacillus agilis]